MQFATRHIVGTFTRMATWQSKGLFPPMPVYIATALANSNIAFIK
jgi:hypothetical protein